VENVGTIPVKLLNYGFTNGGYDDSALDVTVTVPEDTQLHPSDTHDITINITVLQDASEDTTYSFELEFTYAQWNEVT
jgi:hypothetical protein